MCWKNAPHAFIGGQYTAVGYWNGNWVRARVAFAHCCLRYCSHK